MKNYPGGIQLAIPMDMPPFMAEIVKEIVANLTPSLKGNVRYLNSSQLTEVFDQANIPAYKLQLINKP